MQQSGMQLCLHRVWWALRVIMCFPSYGSLPRSSNQQRTVFGTCIETNHHASDQDALQGNEEQ